MTTEAVKFTHNKKFIKKRKGQSPNQNLKSQRVLTARQTQN